MSTDLYEKLVFYYLHEDLLDRWLLRTFYKAHNTSVPECYRLPDTGRRHRGSLEDAFSKELPFEQAVEFFEELIKVGIIHIVDDKRGFRNDTIALDISFKKVWEEKNEETLKKEQEVIDLCHHPDFIDYRGLTNSLLAIAVLAAVFTFLLPLIVGS